MRRVETATERAERLAKKHSGERARRLRADANLRKIVRDRDVSCRLWAVLTDYERGQMIGQIRDLGAAHLDLEVAHIRGRGAAPALKHDPENCVLISRIFHRRLDEYTHPITGETINRDQRMAWLMAAREGRR